MGRPFSWSRLGRSFKDAWKPVAGARAMLLRLTALLAASGYAVGAVVKPEDLLPESPWAIAALALLAALLFAVPVEVAYRLRSHLEEMPAVDRDLLRELKVAAGRAADGFIGSGLFWSSPRTAKVIDDLRRAYAGLRHYPDVYRKARTLEGHLRYLASENPTGRDYAELLDPAEQAYERLIAACNELLTPQEDPQRSKAD